MLNALKWLVKFLETRFPEKRQFASQSGVDALVQIVATAGQDIDRLEKEVEMLQKQIEILNLRVGLTRATQAPFGRK
jgi:hypothetical protein